MAAPAQAQDQAVASAVVAQSSSTSGLTINLHPLAILNISDHANRSRLVNASPEFSPIGALLGSQSGREISIVNSFELLLADAADASAAQTAPRSIDQEFLETRRDQFSQVFPSLTVVGWYTVKPVPTEVDIILHQQFSNAIETSGPPIFLIFNPSIPVGSQNLPIKIYESALVESSTGEGSNGQFVEVEYGIETGEAERIAVDGVSKETSGDGDESGYIGTLTTQRNAIRMLVQKVQVLAQYTDAVVNNNTPPDHSLLRQIHGLVASLPVMSASELKLELSGESDDVQLTDYLATLMKTLEALSEYSDKHGVLYPQNGDEALSGQGRGKQFNRGIGGFGQSFPFDISGMR